MRGKHVAWLGALLLLAGLLLALAMEGGAREAAQPARSTLVSPAVRHEPLARPASIEEDDPLERIGVQPERQAALAEEHATLEPEVELGRALGVRVVDSRGARQRDVHVLLRIEGMPFEGWGETTDREGLATFRVRDEGPLGERALATVSIDGLFERRIEASVQLAEWPEEPVELVLPENGAVIIEVVDETGAPRSELRQNVQLRIDREVTAGAQLWGAVEGIERAPLEQGRARFPRVEVGLSLHASLDARPVAGIARITFPGPLQPGEEVVERLEVSTPAVVLLFRMLDESGLPLAHATLRSSLTRRSADGGTTGSGDFFLETDGSGRARLPLREPWQEGTTVTLRLARSGAHRTDHRSASLDLSRSFPAGGTDLGDIRLRESPLLVAGHVVDDAGEPVIVTVLVLEAHEPVGGAEPSWQEVLMANTGDDGSFAFHDGEARGKLRLSVSSSEFIRPEQLVFARGAGDVRIVLERGGALEGSVAAPDGVLPHAFRVELEPGSEESSRSELVMPDGRFALLGLRPGSVDVALRLVQGNVRLLQVPNVVVVTGETTHDPRLQEIDLTRLLCTLRIGVRLPDGRPATSGWVRVLGSERGAAYLIVAGEALVAGRAGSLDLEVQVPGCRIERLLQVERDTEVRLQDAFRVRIELAREVELPPAGSSLQVRLLRQAQPGEAESVRVLELFSGGEMMGWWSESFGDETNSFDASREVLVSVQEPGTYSVELFYVTEHPDGGMTSWNVDTAEGLSLELDERDAEKTFRVAPDPESYAGLRAGRR